MEKHHLKINDRGIFVNNYSSRDRIGMEEATQETTPSDLVLQWGSRKRLRCMKVQAKGKDGSAGPVHRTTVRVDRRVVRAAKDPIAQNHPSMIKNSNQSNNGNVNPRHRPISPPQRVLRKTEIKGGMRGQAASRGGNGCLENKRSNNNKNKDMQQKADATSDSSGEVAAGLWWPGKVVIGLTNKEKEEDFMAIKGSKLPQRPKKRAKLIQRTINLVSPGTWLCDLTLERYEVREKKISKKRPRGLKAIVNMESDSE